MSENFTIDSIEEPTEGSAVSQKSNTMPIEHMDQNIATEPSRPKISPGVIVLQWLTYAFWGWTIFATSCLSGAVFAYYVLGEDTSSMIPYAVAAVLVLLPLSAICDYFYSKKEPEKKTGASAVVMIIHAVLFAIFGIGALISAVFSLVSLFIGNNSEEGMGIVLGTSLIVFVLYAVAFLRALLPFKPTLIRRLFVIIMVAVIGLMCFLGFIGPVAGARLTRTDRLIESNLSSLSYSISSYVRDNKRLPTRLSDLPLREGEKELVDENLVVYKPMSSTSSTSDILKDIGSNRSSKYSIDQGISTYRYQLCVDYKKAKEGKSYSSRYDDSDGYSTSVDNYTHPAGNVCYKLKVTSY